MHEIRHCFILNSDASSEHRQARLCRERLSRAVFAAALAAAGAALLIALLTVQCMKFGTDIRHNDNAAKL